MLYYPAENDKADNNSNQSNTIPVSNRLSEQPFHNPLEKPYNYSTRPALNSITDPEEMPAFTAVHHSTMSPMMPQDPFHSMNTAAFDLQEVICQFRAQPELLQLILNSKVEEDRRKAEEAKLRGKEIDYYLQRKHSQELSMEKPASGIHEPLAPVPVLRRDMGDSTSQHSHTSNSSLSISSSSDMYSKQETRSHRSLTISSPLSQGAFMSGILPQPSRQRRHSAFESLIFSPNGEKRSGSYDGHDDDNYQARKRSYNENSPRQSSTSPKSSDIEFVLDDDTTHVGSRQPNVFQIETKKKRKRREMQAVTTIVETRDPQNDDYLWKNNGNTLHKKSGQKSTYYKCSNSNKGCPVNKTVTLRDNNTYLIKYRGAHLAECHPVKRIVDI